jgi:hypothetical protein
MTLRFRILPWLVVLCAFVPGCTNLNYNVDPLPKAVPVQLEDVPPAALEAFRRHHPEAESPIAERCVDEKRGYRFTLPSGGWVAFDKEGQRLGGVH